MEQIVDNINHSPEEVFRVIYHMMAKPTTEDPNNDMF